MEQPDPLAAAGPVDMIGVELAGGHKAVIVFHESGEILEVLAPLESGIETGLSALLMELNVSPDAVTWTNEHLDRLAILAHAEPLPWGR